MHLLARAEGESLPDALIAALGRVQGAFSLLLLTGDTLVAARDPYGFRPLSIGKFNGSYVVASESCAFDLINASYVREVQPGEIVAIRGEEIESFQIKSGLRQAKCIFEHVYFATTRQHRF